MDQREGQDRFGRAFRMSQSYISNTQPVQSTLELIVYNESQLICGASTQFILFMATLTFGA